MPNISDRIGAGPTPLREIPENTGIPQPGATWWGDQYATYAIGVWGQVHDAIQRLHVRNSTPREDGFDPLDHIPQGYEQYADDYAWAETRAEVETITMQIDENLAYRRQLSHNSMLGQLGHELLAGVFDPINLIAGPTLKGVGFVRGAGRSAGFYGSLNAGQELVRGAIDPTSTTEETALNISLGYAVAGLFGGVAGKIGRAAEEQGRAPGEVRGELVTRGDRLAETLSRIEGNPVRERVEFNGNGVKVVDGPTGKRTADGRYVPAFLRKKETIEQQQYRARVERAADDLLGDVIPEGDEAPARAPDEPDFEGLEAMADEVEIDDVPPWRTDEPDEDVATPFGGRREDGGGSSRTGEDGEAEDTIFIDSRYILDQFEEKPWTRSQVEGVDPLPEDAFKTPEEWLNFVFLHELNHKTTRQNAGESMAAYENRINKMAYDEVLAGRMPLAPVNSSKIANALLSVLPIGRLARLAPKTQEAHKLFLSIAGDHTTMTLGNKVGQATTPGGSVFQKGMRWNLQVLKALQAIDRGYAKYVNGTVDAKGRAGATVDAIVAGIPVIGKAARQGKLTRAQWRAYVGRATDTDEPFEMFAHPLSDADMAIVRESAATLRQVLRNFEKDARELGMFDVQKHLQTEVAWRRQSIERDMDKIARWADDTEVGKAVREEIAAKKAEIEEMEAELAALKETPIKPAGEEHYFSRIYNVQAIRERFDEFVAKLGDHWGGTEEAYGRAKKVADNIIGQGMDETEFIGPTLRNLRSRKIDLPNRELADFLVWDAEAVIGIYARRMGPAIEMQRKFGSRMLDKQMDELKARLREDGVSEKNIRKTLEIIEDGRDRVLGRFHTSDPMNLSNRAARVLRNYGNLVTMGSGIEAQFVDVMRAMATTGYRSTFRALRALVSSDMGKVREAINSRRSGDAMEIANARVLAQAMENDSALLVTNQTRVERGLAAAQHPFFLGNLMNPFTVGWKDFMSLANADAMLRDIMDVAAAARSGKTVRDFTPAQSKKLQRLASFGIDLRGAQMIADMPIDKSEASDLLLANVDAWEGRAGEHARDLFLGAINGEGRLGTLTPGPATRPAIYDGVWRWKGERKEWAPLGLPFQLLSFATTGAAKISHSVLTGRERNTVSTVLSLLAGGAVVSYLKFGFQDLDEFIYSTLDYSGLGAYFMDATKRFETLSNVGPRSAFGMHDFDEGKVSDEVGAVAGPSLGVVSGVIEAFSADGMSDNQRAALLRRGVIGQNLIWFDDTMNTVQQLLAENGAPFMEGEETEPAELAEAMAD